jgi:enamine deaminase RidA (YjgF/YER057c/UK114 family)
LSLHDTPCGRLIEHQGCQWITASALPIHRTGTPEAQTWAAFEDAETLVIQAGSDLNCIARTWCYLDDILAWYTNFNATRSRFFSEHKLLNPAQADRLPASTGMGVSPAGGAPCLIDLYAVVGNSACSRVQRDCLCKHLAAGKQRAAFEYGSSFARASTVCTPSGRTVFVSGTAAINPAGATCFLGDIPGQIGMTLDCLRAVLGDLQCPTSNAVQAMAYCKTAEVEAAFRQLNPEPGWPWVIVRGDVCRDNLLFEAEVAGMVGR